MASQEVVESFRGNDTSPLPDIYDDLTGGSSGPHVGSPNPQVWQELDQSFGSATGSFRRAATGTLLAPPISGQARYAKLPFNTLNHTAGVTVFEARLVPGMAMTVRFDAFGSDYQTGIDVALNGSGTIEWDFNPIHTFTGAAPGALATLRIEVESSTVRFYVDGVLKHTKSGGVAYSTGIDSVQLEMPGYYTAHGRPVGVMALALDALKIKTEAVSGSLLPPTEAEQPEATDDPDFRVLFSDTFGTLRALHGSHGETGPLGMSEWAEFAIRDNVSEYEEIVASGNWTRTDGDGLFVEGVDRGEFVEASTAANVSLTAEGGGEATTKLPCVLECRLFSRGLISLGLKRSPTFTDPYFNGYSFFLHLHNNGSARLGAWDENYPLDIPFAAPPPTATDGVLCRLEVWPDHVRAYANGSLVGYIEVDVAERVNNLSGECVVIGAAIQRSAWDYSVEPGRAVFVGVTPAGSSVRLTNLFKLSGVQDSAGPLPAIPPNTEDGSLPPVPGPDNEPSRTDNYASFWTNFNATYEVP